MGNLDTALNMLNSGTSSDLNRKDIEYYTNVETISISQSATLTPVLNIEGIGELKAVYCKGVCNAGKGIFLKVTIDGEIIFNKGIIASGTWTTTGSFQSNGLMVLTDEFIPNTHNGSNYINPLLPGAAYSSSISAGDRYTDGSVMTLSNGPSSSAIVRFLRKIKFNKSLKIEAYSSYASGTVGCAYSLDE